MYYISIYDTEEDHLGWIDSNGNLTAEKNERAGFSSKQTATDFGALLEIQHKDWYTELEE
jgi:hypothetical protein